ncbi:putative ABC transport system permease protein [Weissella uvarum]|uniref:ABC transporter permease n=1 Tax=Weissella uvarum TaxID=1479233 RepID=UPI0019616395|nr:ABC transporter permease [Weissella uvarum]MBM7618051.1 putative ABC transport system permease protein [Weissella uvarum]MCM0595092.1 ABC transporter permease [Weissella uvarum]
MKFKDTVLTAFQALKMNPKRSIMTIIGIVIGIAAVITIMAVGNGVNHMATSQIKSSNKGAQNAQIGFTADDENDLDGFTQADVNLLKQSNLGDKISRIDISALNEDDGQDEAQIGRTTTTLDYTVAHHVKKAPSHLTHGRYFNATELAVGQSDILIQDSVAKRYFGTAQQALGKSVMLGNQAYTIIGTYATDDVYGSAIIPYQAYLKAAGNEGTNLILRVKKGQNPQKIGRAAERMLKKDGTNRNKGTYEYFDTNALIGTISKVLNGLTFFVSAVAAISLFIAGIGVMNMMYISVSERTQEIGIRLAVGATESNIRNQFLIEAMILTAIGGLVGLLMGYLAATIAVKFIPDELHIKAIITLQDVVFAVGVSTAVGLVFGWLPAKQAADKNLIDILR